MTDRAVLLARGLGSRLRREGEGPLDPAQAAAADRGAKAMMPVGRPFLDYQLGRLADAGYSAACVVVAPGAGEVRRHLEGAGRPRRIAVACAVQDEPLGTADAVRAARGFAGAGSFAALNGDNLYPVAALAALRSLPRAGLVAFRASGLVRGGIPAERLGAFALVARGAGGHLEELVEKPGPDDLRRFGADPLVSMNCWLLPPTIFAACVAIAPSPRGELELGDAVRHAITAFGERFEVLESGEPVLDLTTREDVARVTEWLRGVEPAP